MRTLGVVTVSVLALGLGSALGLGAGCRAPRVEAVRPWSAPHADRFVTPAQFRDSLAGAGAVEARLRDLVGERRGGDASEAGGGGGIVAAVVPHHLVAGHLVAGLLAYLADDPPGTVVVVGPDHFRAGPRCGTSAASWLTPAGLLEADAALALALMDGNLADEAAASHDGEHSVGALMPFIKHYLPGTRVVPVTLRGDATYLEAVRLGRYLGEWQAQDPGRKLFVLASVDFSHYLPLARAAENDEATIIALRGGHWAALFAMGPGHLDSPGSLAVAFSFAGVEALDEPVFSAVEHTNSALLLNQPDLPETTSHFLIVIPDGGR
ncbi:MAG: AmmeMemoRadiSam system protein B [Bacillota bacterium]|nr:MAG: AmmeMemoRadiSam system protein B [Bacillota bacterium]